VSPRAKNAAEYRRPTVVASRPIEDPARAAQTYEVSSAVMQQHRDHDVAEREKRDHRRNHQHGNRALSAQEPLPKHIRHIPGDGRRHARQRRRRYSHTEQGDRQLI
jgi:hypothetical protein